MKTGRQRVPTPADLHGRGPFRSDKGGRLRLGTNDSQIVGYLVGAQGTKSLIRFSVHHAFQRYSGILNDDADGRNRRIFVFEQRSIVVDSVLHGNAELLIHRARREYLNLVDDVVDALDLLHGTLG